MAKSRRSFLSHFKEVDYFTESMKWRIGKGQTEYKTLTGAVFTSAIFVFLAFFTIMRFIKMVQLSDRDIKSMQQLDFYNSSQKFSGFPFAFGVSNFLGETISDEELLDYGQVFAYLD